MGESLFTVLTLERLFLCVYSSMHLQQCRITEHLATELACIWTSTKMVSHVPLKFGSCHILLTAHTTFEMPFSCVLVHDVQLQRVAVLEQLLTDVTYELAQDIMRLHMLLQVLNCVKGDVTHVTVICALLLMILYMVF